MDSEWKTTYMSTETTAMSRGSATRTALTPSMYHMTPFEDFC